MSVLNAKKKMMMMMRTGIRKGRGGGRRRVSGGSLPLGMELVESVMWYLRGIGEKEEEEEEEKEEGDFCKNDCEDDEKEK